MCGSEGESEKSKFRAKNLIKEDYERRGERELGIKRDVEERRTSDAGSQQSSSSSSLVKVVFGCRMQRHTHISLIRTYRPFGAGDHREEAF